MEQFESEVHAGTQVWARDEKKNIHEICLSMFCAPPFYMLSRNTWRLLQRHSRQKIGTGARFKGTNTKQECPQDEAIDFRPPWMYVGSRFMTLIMIPGAFVCPSAVGMWCRCTYMPRYCLLFYIFLWLWRQRSCVSTRACIFFESQLDSSWMFIFLATHLLGEAMGTETEGCVSDTLTGWGTDPEWQ